MGAMLSTPRQGTAGSQDSAEYLIGNKSFPLESEFWQKLLEVPLHIRWPAHRVHDACQLFTQNNCYTRHLAKILILLAWCLQELISAPGAAPPVYVKATSAVYLSSVFLKYLIKNTQGDSIGLYLSLDENEPMPKIFTRGCISPYNLSGYSGKNGTSFQSLEYTCIAENGQLILHALEESAELRMYTDFLRIVLEIVNAILTCALPRNPEVVYAVMHRQEVFQPFRNHPCFNELLENIYTVLDFFNSHMDAQKLDGEWSVEKVQQLINNNCQSWRGEGMKEGNVYSITFLVRTRESSRGVLYSLCVAVGVINGYSFNPSAINLFPVDLPLEEHDDHV